MMILKNAIKTTGAKTAVDEFIEERNFNKMVYEIIVPDTLYGHLVIQTKRANKYRARPIFIKLFIALVILAVLSQFPLLETMVCGCPIVASRIPSTEEIASSVPIYFEPNNIEKLVQALDTAVREGRNSPRVNLGLAHVLSYSWDRAALETLTIYKSLL